MKANNHYKQQIEVYGTAQEAFHALNEGLNLWWGNISNSNFKNGGQFTITFENGYWWTFKIIEYTPNKELIWKCIDGEPEFNKEWIGHILQWSITENTSKSIIAFQQIGLTSELHCYNVCSSTWDMFIVEKLKTFIEQNSIQTKEPSKK